MGDKYENKSSNKIFWDKNVRIENFWNVKIKFFVMCDFLLKEESMENMNVRIK